MNIICQLPCQFDKASIWLKHKLKYTLEDTRNEESHGRKRHERYTMQTRQQPCPEKETSAATMPREYLTSRYPAATRPRKPNRQQPCPGNISVKSGSNQAPDQNRQQPGPGTTVINRQQPCPGIILNVDLLMLPIKKIISIRPTLCFLLLLNSNSETSTEVKWPTM